MRISYGSCTAPDCPTTEDTAGVYYEEEDVFVCQHCVPNDYAKLKAELNKEDEKPHVEPYVHLYFKDEE